MTQSVLVVGGAGYIGSVTVEHLVAAGHSVVVLDNLSRGHRHAVVDGAELVVGDLCDNKMLETLLATRRFEAVMHFSASSIVGESVQAPLDYYQNNIANGANLLQAMRANGVQNIVFSSTAAIFGDAAKQPICEDDLKAPANPYGRTKLVFEHLLDECEAAYGLRSVCLRYFNAAGATENCGEDHRPETHLIPLILQAARGMGEAITIFGDNYPTRDGTCVRDYVHVSDLAGAHILALRHLLEGGRSEKFNLGNGQGFTVREVIAAAERVAGKSVPYRTGARRTGDPNMLVASSEKIRRELGWQPKYPQLNDIIESAWNWMQKNPDGYRG
ncbi:MAG: UDP-glucose 4-epimerase GalE [Candidatus Sumerlaeaceae bacterium]